MVPWQIGVGSQILNGGSVVVVVVFFFFFFSLNYNLGFFWV